MKFIDLAKERFSVRKFDGRPVAKDALGKILEAGCIAPTAKNIQPQKVFVIQSQDGLEKINAASPCIYGSTTVLLVCYDKDLIWKNPFDSTISSGDIDVSIILTHMMLEAQECGVNSCWVECFNHSEVIKLFNLPANIIPVAVMPLGYAADGVVPSENHTRKKDIGSLVEYI